MAAINITTDLGLSGQPTALPYVPMIAVFAITLFSALFFGNSSNKFAKSKSLLLLPPGPPAWPIVGNLPEMLMNRPTAKWIHRVMEEMKTEIACFRFGRFNVIAVTSDEIAREAFRDKDVIFTSRPKTYLAERLTSNKDAVLFSPFGPQWKKIKKVMTSELMSQSRLNWLIDQRNTGADHVLAYVYNLYNQSETAMNVRDVASTYCHGVMMRMMFGRRYFKEASKDGGMGPMEREHVDAIIKAVDNIYTFALSDYVPCFKGWNLDGQDQEIREAVAHIIKHNTVVIDERLELWRNRGGKEAVEDWLDVLITLKDDEGKPFLERREIAGVCKEICVATIDNPINNFEWTIAEMLNQPETLEKAVNELDRVVGKDRLVQESDIPQLNYIKGCIRESYRLHPIAAFIPPHVALEDATLAGYFIPKGSQVYVARLGLGRNSKIWPEPQVFRPERHLTGNLCSNEVSLAETDMRFGTFGVGRRSCVATRLGSLMTVMQLARLLQGFTWSLPPGSGPVRLVESKYNMLMAKPLIACVEPRLGPQLYPKLRD